MKKMIKAIAASSLLVASAGVFAATQGSLGATSSGSVDINVTITDVVQISGLTDANFGTYVAGTGDLTNNGTACVYRNGTGLYQMTVSTTGSVLEVSDGTNAIPYALTINGTPITASGQVLTGQAGNAVDPTCGGGTNATIDVVIAETDLQAAPSSATAYTSTVTMLVAPE